MKRDHQEGGTHYVDMPVQPWDVIDTWHDREAFYRGNALKYLMRFGAKHHGSRTAAIEDARKARHYLDKLIAVLGGDDADDR